MTKINWPRIAAPAAIISFVLFIGLTWLWYFAGNGSNGMMEGWGFEPFSGSGLMLLGLMHLSFWMLFIAGMVWVLQLIDDRA